MAQINVSDIVAELQAKHKPVARKSLGRGLFITVRGGSIKWEFQHRVPGQKYLRSIYLGSVADMGIRAARDAIPSKADRAAPVNSRAARTPRRAPQAVAGKPFADALREWLADPQTKYDAKGLQARGTLTKLSLAGLDIAAITQADVIAALDGMGAREHADKRGWLAKLFAYAKAKQWRNGDNPSRFDKDTLEGFPQQAPKKKRPKQPSLEWHLAPEFFGRLGDTAAARALALIVLTAVRAGSVENMTWGQIDGDVWTIPATKEGEALDVPLSAAALKVIGKRPHGAKSDAKVFALPSKNALLNTLRAFSYRDDAGNMVGYRDPKSGEPVVVHGFRSTFKTWAQVRTTFKDEISEIALGHAKGDVRSRYARGNDDEDYFAKRRQLMTDWADFATGGKL